MFRFWLHSIFSIFGNVSAGLFHSVIKSLEQSLDSVEYFLLFILSYAIYCCHHINVQCASCCVVLFVINWHQGFSWKTPPGKCPFCNRQHPSYDGCLEVRGEIIRTVLCCIMYCKLCTVISTLSWAVLTVRWIGFCLSEPISLCPNSLCLCFCLFCHTAYVLYYCNTVGWTWWHWSLILRTHLPSVLWRCGQVIWPVKARPRYDL